jgi:GntR family transcriptional repressor for pyruvate dehydrogenase complex
MFERISETRKPIFVVEQILKSLKTGDLKPGDRLPAESKLAELTGVGRTSVREALAALRLMGVVETKIGNGTYVQAIPDLDTIKSEINETIKKSEEVFQLQEARAAFECGIVRLAAERFDNKDIDAFKKTLGKMRQAAKASQYEDFVKHHKAFHLLIAKSTENSVIEETALSFLKIMEKEGWRDVERQYYLPGSHEFLEESVEIHSAIFDALRQQDAVLATELMQKHFVRYR